jgi:hypothetical protein
MAFKGDTVSWYCFAEAFAKEPPDKDLDCPAVK